MGNKSPATATIVSVSLGGTEVAKTYNDVINLNYDFHKGVVNIVDRVQGSFYFPYNPITTVIHVINDGYTTFSIFI